ncbi:MAG TPA: alpha/beta fold hydrolase [Clostridiaceae bacterium]
MNTLSNLMAEGIEKNIKDTTDTYKNLGKSLGNLDNWMQNPLDIFNNYFDFTHQERKPLQWSTENEVIIKSQAMNLLHFPNTTHEVTAKYPILVSPPNAGHDSKLADFSPTQSLVRTLHSQGFDVYVNEWLSATKEDSDLGIDSYVNFTHKSVEKIKSLHNVDKIHLLGQCQGGWQVSMYTSLHPENISSLVVAAAPINFHADYGVMNVLVDNMKMEDFEKLTTKGYLAGADMLKSFKMLQPNEHEHLKYIKEYIMVLEQDKKAMDRTEHFSQWYDNPQNLARRYYLEIVKNVFMDNCMANGGFSIDGREIDLRNIKCPLVLIGGTKDHITPPEQCFGMSELVSTPQDQIHKFTVSAGHIGALMGGSVLKNEYPKICDIMKASEVN